MKNLTLIYLFIFSLPVMADFTHAEKHYQQAEYTKSFDEYHKLAKLGNIRAQYRIAVMYFDGIGVEKNAIQAYAWSKTAGSSKSSTKELSDKIEKTLNANELDKAKYIKRPISFLTMESLPLRRHWGQYLLNPHHNTTTYSLNMGFTMIQTITE